jgi:quinoprotein relay system zinc metallohydrolase 2
MRRNAVEEAMFHLVVTACLTADPAVCADRLLPAPAPLTEAGCATTAPARITSWADLHPDLVTGDWRCIATGALPALPVREIATGVYVHVPDAEPLSTENGGDIANLGFIIGDTVAVVDPGGSRDIGERLYAAIRLVSDRPISHAFITHMHPDHSFGAEVFAEAGAQIAGHRNLSSGLERRMDAWADSIPRQAGVRAMLGTRVRLPDRSINAPEVIDLGGARLRLDPVPTAHTDNDLTVYHEESGTLFTGDLVFADLTPSIDGSVVGWLAWLSTPPNPLPRQIVAGHGPVPMDWDSGTAATRTYLTAVVEQTRAAIRAGEPMSVAVGHIAADQRGDWRGFDDMNPHNATAAFKELEWE